MLFSILRRHVLLEIGLTWMLFLLVPAIMAAVLFVAATKVAERYLYAPSIGFLIALVWLLLMGLEWLLRVTGWPPRKGWIIASLLWLVLVTAWGWESWNRNAMWRSNLTFWEAAVAGLPEKPLLGAVAHHNLGIAYKRMGRLDEAISEHQMALKIKPDYATAYESLGDAYIKQWRLDEAVMAIKRALTLEPNDAGAHNKLGIAYAKQGALKEAINAFQKALKLTPYFSDAHNNLGNVFKDLGRLEEAIQEYQMALKLKSEFAGGHYNLGKAYQRKGRINEAINSFERTLQINPDFLEARQALESLTK